MVYPGIEVTNGRVEEKTITNTCTFLELLPAIRVVS